MGFQPIPETPPLRQDTDGALRVGNTRVLLELVLQAFQDGATPEEIVQRYSTLSLADVYSVVAYYLRHRPELDAYLARCDAEAEQVRGQVESSGADIAAIRARLNARRRAG